MDFNNLPHFKWKGLSVFQENGKNLVVLECETGIQTRDFFNILSSSKFSFSIDRSNAALPRLYITFDTGVFRISILLAEDILSKYFSSKNINLLTTGFDLNGGLACLDDRLEITKFHTFNLN